MIVVLSWDSSCFILDSANSFLVAWLSNKAVQALALVIYAVCSASASRLTPTLWLPRFPAYLRHLTTSHNISHHSPHPPSGASPCQGTLESCGFMTMHDTHAWKIVKMLGIWAGYSLQSNKGKTSTFDFHLFAPVCLLMSHHLSSFLPPAISCNAKDQNGVAQLAPPQQRIARQLQDITRWGGFGKALAA